MHSQIAERIVDLLNGSPEPSQYKRIKALPLPRGTVENFHRWADGHNAKAGFLFERNEDGVRYWLLVIEWNVRIGPYYLVIYPENRSGPILEIHRFAEESALKGELSWTYTPRKHDGRNKVRKERFCSIFSSTEVQISIPEEIGDTDIFLDEIFLLADSRLKADMLGSWEKGSWRDI